MSEPYGMHVRFTAKTGEADALEGVLLQAAEDARADENCLLYVVSRSPDAPDVVLVTEAWTDRAAHDASLEDPATRALIATAMPLISGSPVAEHLRPVGGKGL